MKSKVFAMKFIFTKNNNNLFPSPIFQIVHGSQHLFLEFVSLDKKIGQMNGFQNAH